MPPVVYRGPIGKLVETLTPHTEADPHAILMQALAAWGSLIGRGPYYQVEGDRHYTNLFVNLVGVTSKARKGTSWGRTRGVLSFVDAEWAHDCLLSGLGSGEGLIDVVGAKENPDKRCLIIESELARLLAVLSREGSTISAILRDAWDTGTLAVIVRHNKVKLHGAHISSIGHITRDELVRKLDTTEMANGLCNRMLWVCARRFNILPHGGGSPDLSSVIRAFIDATKFAQQIGDTRIKMDSEASECWECVYEELSAGTTGLLGAVTSRAEAQVVRIALIYALLDCSPVITGDHLAAALAVWRYCYESARFIWGAAIGDPMADAILDILRRTPKGLTRSEISAEFARNRSASDLDRAIGILLAHGRLRTSQENTGGRPVTRYFSL
jgi:hypothetical protein